ncbi:MAG: hypothetical protein WB489_17945 [Pseudolabrys sp.]
MKQGNSDNEVEMYSDFKSPYAYIAFDPGMALSERLRRQSARSRSIARF